MQAEGQCRAGQLLAGLGLDISLPALRAVAPAAAKDLLMVLYAKRIDATPALSESRSLAILLTCMLLKLVSTLSMVMAYAMWACS